MISIAWNHNTILIAYTINVHLFQQSLSKLYKFLTYSLIIAHFILFIIFPSRNAWKIAGTHIYIIESHTLVSKMT